MKRVFVETWSRFISSVTHEVQNDTLAWLINVVGPLKLMWFVLQLCWVTLDSLRHHRKSQRTITTRWYFNTKKQTYFIPTFVLFYFSVKYFITIFFFFLKIWLNGNQNYLQNRSPFFFILLRERRVFDTTSAYGNVSLNRSIQSREALVRIKSVSWKPWGIINVRSWCYTGFNNLLLNCNFVNSMAKTVCRCVKYYVVFHINW